MSFSSSEKSRLNSQYGPWAVVTGASSGIGKEIAERLGEAGLHLILSARRGAILQTMAAKLKSQYGVEVKIVEADLSTNAGIKAVNLATQSEDVGIYVGAAGYGTSGDFIKAPLEKELNMLDLNCGASIAQTHYFANRFVQRGRGGIILFSSLVAFQGVPYSANYAATKAYIQTFAEALAVELKGTGVDVLSAAPGPVASGFADRADMKMGKSLSPADVSVPILKALGRRTTVFPGFLTKFLTGSLSMLPRWGKVRVMKLIMGGFTKHQRTAV